MHDCVNDSVSKGFIAREKKVALGVLRNALDRLARVPGENLVERVSQAQNLAGLYVDVLRLSGKASGELVDHHP